MGKGEIISHLGDGQYSVKLLNNRVKSDKALARINGWILMREEQIAALPVGDPEHKLPMLKLSKAALEKQKEYLEKIPGDQTVSAWCTDLSTELSGIVGTIEINGDPDADINIRPGYAGNAAHSPDRDGQAMNIRAMTPEQAFYNLAMMPGWQKWMPTYRTGEITAIDGDTCSVILDTAASIQQGLNINEKMNLTGVQIEYMECNGAAFAVGDRVVLEYRDRWSTNTPVVIGFESEPKPCEFYIRIKINGITPTKIKTVYLVEQETGKVHMASSHAPIEPPSELFAYDVCGPFSGVIFPAKLFLARIDGTGDTLFEFWCECADGAPDHKHFGSSIYPYEYPFGSYLYGGFRDHGSLPHTREIIAKKIERARYATPLTAVPTLSTVHNFANMKILRIALYQKLDQDGCGDLIQVTDKKYYPQVWQGFYPQVLGGAYPPNAECSNWGVWYACESGYFGEEFGDPIYDDFAAQYTAGTLVPNNAVAILTDADGLSPAHTTWEWKIQNFYPYPEPDFVPRYEDGAFWRISAIDTPLDRI